MRLGKGTSSVGATDYPPKGFLKGASGRESPL